MGWRAKAGREQKALASIVARLLSIADMAERASFRSSWVRWCVLWVAWQANALLRDYVEGGVRNAVGRQWSPVPMPVGFGADPGDAHDLGASLRALALFVEAMAAQLCRLSFLHRGQASDAAGNEGGLDQALLRRLAGEFLAPVELRDTS